MIDEYDKEIKILDKQIEIEKNLFVHNILNGIGTCMKKELESPPVTHKPVITRIKNFFYKIFNTF
jgi:hypothetical protein